ncbi:MAG: hypothetical protein HYY55_03715 [Candidatus Niyogibacteria bacterium]|nr:MAG: hypothetical protein HYY55_03715 [Candidatus Niyogibacteria bacterium]
MILGIDIVHKLISEKKLIENLSERELKNPEGAVIDLRIARALRLEGDGFLGIEERETPKMEVFAEFDPNKKSALILKPGDYFVTETIEKFNMPEDLMAIMKPRTTLHRMGIIGRQTIADPGFHGTVHPALYNAGQSTITIEMGARYMQVFFVEIKGKANLYRGQWQGGRATTDGREKQI